MSLFPPHLHYVEPYFGGGSVLLARDPRRDWMIDYKWKLTNGDSIPAHLRGCSEVVNDINGELTNFWSVLRSKELWPELQHLLSATPLCELTFEDVRASERDYATGIMPEWMADNSTRAWWFFIQCRQSRQGLGKDFATLSRNRTRGGRNEQANAWLSAIDGLPEIHERLQGVVILNRDALDVIRQQDGEHTLFYCDPPYVHSTRSTKKEYGQHEMTEEQHCELMSVLNNIKGKFMLSGYHSDLYDTWRQQQGYTCHEMVIDNKASGAKTKQQKVECVWTNF